MIEIEDGERIAVGWLQSFIAALKLGLLSFGGPTAHIGYFREEYVAKKGWLDDRSFADLVALCQLLPGPASSQLGMAIGWLRAGWLGSIAAWVGFTLPSAAAMAGFAYLYESVPAAAAAGWIKGLTLAAVAIVAGAVAGMARTLAPDPARAAIAVASAAAVLLLPLPWMQAAVIAAAGAAGMLLKPEAARDAAAKEAAPPLSGGQRWLPASLLILFGAILLTLPAIRSFGSVPPLLALFESFYRAGALVFGGGHVVMPLLERELVPSGLVAPEQFMAGYAAAQAVPGPLFTFASYLGAIPGGWTGAAIATVAVFLPGYLLVIGTLPFWQSLRRMTRVMHALYGINAAVVGILLAALYDPLFTKAVHGAADFVIAAALYVLSAHWKLPPWALVLTAAATGTIVYGWP